MDASLPVLLTVVLLVLIVVVLILVVILVQTKCRCPIDQAWLDKFNKWAEARYIWEMLVQDWITTYNECLNEKCGTVGGPGGGTNPPDPPPCKFGSC